MATPSGLAVRRSEPNSIHRVADAPQSLRRGHAPAGVREPLDRLLQLAGALTGALRRIDAEAVVTEPCGGAEDRLVDSEVKPSGGHRAPAAQLVSQLRPPELEHLHRLLAGVEASRDSDPASVVELVGERETVAASCPGLVARPVAAIDRAALTAGVDAVERTAHGAQQR